MPCACHGVHHNAALRGSGRRRCCNAKSPVDVLLDNLVEFIGNVLAPQGHRFFAINEYRGGRCLPGSGQADSDVGVLALSGPVDDATHHCNSQIFHTRIANSPDRHLGTQKIINLLCKILEGCAGSATTTRSCGDTWDEYTQAQRLQYFGCDHDLLRTGFARLRSQGHTDGVADTFLQQY